MTMEIRKALYEATAAVAAAETPPEPAETEQVTDALDEAAKPS